MTIILLVRHAENDFIREGKLAGRIPDVHLNNKGVEQAQQLAISLKKVPIGAIYSSPLERALETVQWIADEKKMKILKEQAINEIDYGDWQGEKISRLKKTALWKKMKVAPSFIRFPNGETFLEAQQRAIQFILALLEQWSEKQMVLCVTHADIIKLIIAYFLGLPLDHFQRIEVGTASITGLSFYKAEFRLLMLSSPTFSVQT